jgi:hypothetical protein
MGIFHSLHLNMTAGVEYAQECYCGNSFTNGGGASASSGCTMACQGDVTQTCGGPNRLSVFSNNATVLSPRSGGSRKRAVALRG